MIEKETLKNSTFNNTVIKFNIKQNQASVAFPFSLHCSIMAVTLRGNSPLSLLSVSFGCACSPFLSANIPLRPRKPHCSFLQTRRRPNLVESKSSKRAISSFQARGKSAPILLLSCLLEHARACRGRVFHEIFISIFTFRNIDRNIANVFLSWGKNIFHVLSLDAKKKKRERSAA